MRDRVIMHIDMNAFYASVAQHLNPTLRGRPVVVAGDPKKRNGIILAKSREAKAAGVITAEPLWQAQQKCPGLSIVMPDYAAYKRYSKLARLIYYDYTNQVEPFGLDESWIDVTGSLALFGNSPHLIAQEISERIKSELGLTVSIGVSWNKVFAKLGSDTDPGDGITHITRKNYQEVAWPLDAGNLMYVGKATRRKLHSSGYETIGDIAGAGDYYLHKHFGKIGFMLRSFARGEDNSPVRIMDPARADVDYVIKGIGNGLTAPHDLCSPSEAKALLWLLSESVAQRLRESHLRCKTVCIGVRSASDLLGYSRQITLNTPTCLTQDIANAAFGLLEANQPLDADHAIRSLHVRTTNLVDAREQVQYDLFGNTEALLKEEQLDHCIDALRNRFGNGCIRRVVEMTDEAMAHLDIKRDNTVHPIGYLR